MFALETQIRTHREETDISRTSVGARNVARARLKRRLEQLTAFRDKAHAAEQKRTTELSRVSGRQTLMEDGRFLRSHERFFLNANKVKPSAVEHVRTTKNRTKTRSDDSAGDEVRQPAEVINSRSEMAASAMLPTIASSRPGTHRPERLGNDKTVSTVAVIKNYNAREYHVLVSITGYVETLGPSNDAQG